MKIKEKVNIKYNIEGLSRDAFILLRDIIYDMDFDNLKPAIRKEAEKLYEKMQEAFVAMPLYVVNDQREVVYITMEETE